MTATQTRESLSAPTQPGKYLIFQLGRKQFGIQVLSIREIMSVQEITSGVINLRGKTVPVVDLRLKFAFPDALFTQTTCIVVVEVMQDGDKAMTGLIVDNVVEVVNLAGADIGNQSSIVWTEGPRGAHTRGSVARNTATTGVPTAAARCEIPESLPTKIRACASQQARS